MQILFSVCFLLAVASATFIFPPNYGHNLLNQHTGHYNHVNYQLGPNGVLHDTEAVAAAKAVHFAAHADAKSRLAYGHGVQNNNPIDTPEVQIAKFQHQIAFSQAEQRLANPVLALPLDTPEVQIAKQEHLVKYAEEKFRNSHSAFAHAAGPVDTPEVQLAKVGHLAKYAEEKLRNSHPVFAHAAGPVDTPEVQLAKIQHFHLYAQSQAQPAYIRENGDHAAHHTVHGW